MPVSDPIGDFVTRLRNAQHGRHTECRAPWSSMKEKICNVLKANNYVAEVRVEGEGVEKEVVVVFRTDRPALELRRVSKPGSRQYVGSTEIRPHLHGHSLAIVSTSQGVITGKEAKAKNIGGELLCTIA